MCVTESVTCDLVVVDNAATSDARRVVTEVEVVIATCVVDIEVGSDVEEACSTMEVVSAVVTVDVDLLVINAGTGFRTQSQSSFVFLDTICQSDVSKPCNP